MALSDLMERDKRVKRLANMLETPVYSLDINKLEEEVVLIQKTRLMRSMDKATLSKRFYETSVDSILENNRNRTRLAEIHLLVTIKMLKLSKHISKLKKYLLYKYADRLSNASSTVKGREAIVEMILSDADDRKTDFKNLLSIIEFVMKDIDASSWDSKDIIKVFEIQSERKAVKI